MNNIWYHTKLSLRHTLIVALLVLKLPIGKLDELLEDMLMNLGYYK